MFFCKDESEYFCDKYGYKTNSKEELETDNEPYIEIPPSNDEYNQMNKQKILITSV